MGRFKEVARQFGQRLADSYSQARAWHEVKFAEQQRILAEQNTQQIAIMTTGLYEFYTAEEPNIAVLSTAESRLLFFSPDRAIRQRAMQTRRELAQTSQQVIDATRRHAIDHLLSFIPDEAIRKEIHINALEHAKIYWQDIVERPDAPEDMTRLAHIRLGEIGKALTRLTDSTTDTKTNQ